LRISTGGSGDRRFRWEIHDDDGLIQASKVAFSTSKEAAVAGRLELRGLVAMWNKL